MAIRPYSSFHLLLKSFSIANIESEQWSSAREIAKILDDYLSFDKTNDLVYIKSSLKNILYESINEEDWHLTECIIDLLKNNFAYIDKHNYIIYEQNVRSQFVKILHELTEINNYNLVIEIITTIQENLIGHIQQIEKAKGFKKNTRFTLEKYMKN